MWKFRVNLARPAACGLIALLVLSRSGVVCGGDVRPQDVIGSIARGRSFLLRSQRPDGSWDVTIRKESQAIAITSFVLQGLISTGMSPSDPEISRGLDWLRDPKRNPKRTHEIALMIEAFAAARDGDRDHALLADLVRRLESSEVHGANDGSWSFAGGQEGTPESGTAHFAALALFEAQELGVSIDPRHWKAAREHWLGRQNPDGGWGSSRSSGGITAAGIAYVAVTSDLLRDGEPEVDSDGRPLCCLELQRDEAIERACRWLGNNFTVSHNPNRDSTGWLYYLYGLERVGRLTGQRFFTNARGTKRDWYREGCEALLLRQDQLTGSWTGTPEVLEDEPVLATSYALHFLSRGLAPVLINKLDLGNSPGEQTSAEWDQHPHDVKNLMQFITARPHWPRQLSWQSLELSNAGVSDLLQAPIAFLHGSAAPQLGPPEIETLRAYLHQGGFLFAVRGCGSSGFDEGFRDLVRRLDLSSGVTLRRLEGSHPVYRSEYPLIDPATGNSLVELWGVEADCRTCIIYAPEDCSCLWDKWTSYPRPHRLPATAEQIARAMQVGANVVAYVTGREPVNKLEQLERAAPPAGPETPSRDVLQIARVRHTGDWDAAPNALRNLLTGLNKVAGVPVADSVANVSLGDRDLFRFPILAMHGRSHFTLKPDEVANLRRYLEQGGFLFADACCSSAPFDASFRRLMTELFPRETLRRISLKHEVFSTRIAFDLQKVQRHEPPGADSPEGEIRSAEPFLEGLEIDGRLVVIYSRDDLSCALSGRALTACPGYTQESAIQIGINVILYGLRE